MIPNIDPRALKSMMDRLGIKSKEVSAKRVVIEGETSDIIIENPQVTLIEMSGSTIFQIVGSPHHKEKSSKVEVSEEDIKFVSEQTGIKDTELIRKKIEECNGDLAEAILKLKPNSQS
ncbi:MAG: nascent polypeptide-associated complex protein [Candidatus Micrarchaeia archaeon]|jgi:nascent polypeptide-associated complex subunit alpha